MYRVLQRVGAWNAARYEQEHSLPLTVSLLREEQQEFLTAKTPVDKLDALCDLVYVAIGALWKLNVQSTDLNSVQAQAVQVVANQVEHNELWPAMYNSTYIDVLEFDHDYPMAMSLQLIITSSLTQMTGMGLDPEQCTQAMLIVCDANDSKSIKKTNADVKANVDKGPYFVAPEPRLQALLEEARGKLN
jgi:hypothetical protein